jgi:antitoxin component HigA of HigAB toxin-antitoxin module
MRARILPILFFSSSLDRSALPGGSSKPRVCILRRNSLTDSQIANIVDELTDRDNLDEWEKDYLDVLSDLMERYEAEQHPIEPVPDAVILAHLIEAKGITQSALAREAKIAESTISEILKGKRTLTRSQIGRLARCFGVGPTVFHFTS